MSTKGLKINRRVRPKNEVDAVAAAMFPDFLNCSWMRQHGRKALYVKHREAARKVIAALDSYRRQHLPTHEEE